MKVRKVPDEMVFAVIAANNARMVDGVSTSFHKERSVAPSTTVPDYRNPAVTRLAPAAAATNPATQLSLSNNLKSVLNTHFRDNDAHNSTLSPLITTATATDATTAIVLANALKGFYNTHIASGSIHYNVDGTNAVSSVDATDATTLQTLVNEIRTDLIAHMASAPAGIYVGIADA